MILVTATKVIWTKTTTKKNGIFIASIRPKKFIRENRRIYRDIELKKILEEDEKQYAIHQKEKEEEERFKNENRRVFRDMEYRKILEEK